MQAEESVALLPPAMNPPAVKKSLRPAQLIAVCGRKATQREPTHNIGCVTLLHYSMPHHGYQQYQAGSRQVGSHHESPQLGRKTRRHSRRDLSAGVGVLDAQHLALGVGARDQVAARVGDDDVDLVA